MSRVPMSVLLLLSLAGVPGAAAFDSSHGAFQAVLDSALANGRVDYAKLKAQPAALDAYLASLAAAPVASMTPAERKALWINAYNALTIDLVADAYPIGSIRDLDGGKVWDTRRFTVGGESLTLNEIENGRVRPLGDPRIHAALNCAAVGCPPLAAKVYTAAGLDAQLDVAAKRWAATAVVEPGAVGFNQIFDWYGDDFLPGYGAGRYDVPGLEGKEEAAANFVATYAPDKAEALRAGGYTVRWIPYDWALNGKR